MLRGYRLGALDSLVWIRDDRVQRRLFWNCRDDLVHWEGEKKKTLFEICDQNSCRASNVKRESSRKEWSLKVSMHYGLSPDQGDKV